MTRRTATTAIAPIAPTNRVTSNISGGGVPVVVVVLVVAVVVPVVLLVVDVVVVVVVVVAASTVSVKVADTAFPPSSLTVTFTP